MTIMRGWALILPALAFAHGRGQPATQQGDRYTLTGNNVAVYNLVGSIKVERGTGSTVIVDVRRTGRDVSSVRVATGDIDGVPTLRVIFSGDEIASARLTGHSSTNVNVNEDGTFGHGRGGRRVRVSSADSRHGGAMEADADVVIHLPAGVKLSANLAVGDIGADGIASDLTLNTSAGDITASNTHGLLDANTASGNITTTATEGDLTINTASGDIEINGAQATHVRVDVASGEVRAHGIHAQDIHLESASGNIKVTDASAPDLKAESASGNVRVELNGTVRNVEVSTASGNAEIIVPAGFGGEVEMDTSSGDIDVDFPISITRQRRNYLRGTIGTGDAHVSMSAASGNVRLLKR